MSARFGEIDLNSDAVNGEVHGVNTSESTVGFNARCSEGLGSMGNLERECDGKLAGIGVGGQLNGDFGETDTFRGVSACSENSNEGLEMNNSSVFLDERVVDRGGERISVGNEGEREVAVVSGSQHVEVKPDMGDGGAVDLDLVYGGVKAEQLFSEDLNLVRGEGEWKSGSGTENEGTVVNGDTGVLVHLVYDTTPIKGFGSNGNQNVVIEDQMKDTQQLEDTETENNKQTSRVKEFRTEKEGQFHVSDLVWAKVRSHPWWPGQIFDPSDASEKARRCSKKYGFLIAYFGDKTYAWNEALQIKPFQMHFSQMETQSGTEAFSHAVDCALEEVSRRVEFGLACSCLSPEVYDKIKTQVTVNAGIREESSRRDGGDESSSVASFMPANILKNVKAVAQSPYAGIDRLEFVIARAQLLAISRWKGFYCLPEFQMLGGSLEDNSDIPVTGESKYSEDSVRVNKQYPLRKGKLVIQDTSSRKRKEIPGAGVSLSKKERCLSDLMNRSHSNLSNVKGEPEVKVGSDLKSSSSVKKRKALVKEGSGEGENGSNKRSSRSNSEKSQRRKVIPTEYSSPEEMLSQIYMASRDPVEGYNYLSSSVSFFTEFRNSFCMENSTLLEDKNPTGKLSRKKSGKNLPDVGATETSGVGGTEDSYWTDMIVQSNTEEQVLFEPENPKGNGSPTIVPETTVESGQGLDLKQEAAVINSESGIKPEGDEEYTPTALILNFADLESVPSALNLNDIFSRYGPLIESDTEVLKKSKRAKVVFKRRSDAETAFSSSGKFSTFGPSLVSYRLNFLASTPRRSPTSATKRSKKGATSVAGNGA